MKCITTTLAAAAVVVGLAATADAESGSPGRKGTIAAYAPISQVFDSERCTRTKYSWDYVSCGRVLRERVKERMCRSRGKGSHAYYYQVGDGKKSKSSVYCKDGDRSGGDTGGDDGDDRDGGDDGGGDGGGDTGNGRAGHRDSVAAYYPLRSQLFDSQRCHKRRLGYDYTACGSILRARVKRRICAARGKGTHTWYYQIGANKKSKSSVYCRR